MKNSTVAVLGFAVLAVLGSGCRAMTGRSLGTNIDDKTITASVKTKISLDQPRNLTWVDVDTTSGVVYLSGTAPSAAEARRVAEVARSANGVRQVVNNLQIAPAPGSTARAAGTPAASPSSTAVVTPQRLSGEVTSIDAASGRVSLKTPDGDLILQLPPAAVRNLQPGDRLTVDLAVGPGR
jgi:hyperosmotically inducible periplasmic protein